MSSLSLHTPTYHIGSKRLAFSPSTHHGLKESFARPRACTTHNHHHVFDERLTAKTTHGLFAKAAELSASSAASPSSPTTVGKLCVPSAPVTAAGPLVSHSPMDVG
jgi:hypothetical protein